MYDFNLLEMDFDEAVTMLTQYAHECEPVDIDAVKELYKDEVLRTEIENDVEGYMYKYNEFLREHNNYDDVLYNDIDELMEGATPSEVARATFYGKFNFAYPYMRYDGEGCVESLQEYEAKREMTGNDDFLNYLIKHDSNFNEEEYSELIRATNKGLRKAMLFW